MGIFLLMCVLFITTTLSVLVITGGEIGSVELFFISAINTFLWFMAIGVMVDLNAVTILI